MTKDQLIEELKKRLIEYSDTGYYSSDYSTGVINDKFFRTISFLQLKHYTKKSNSQYFFQKN